MRKILKEPVVWFLVAIVLFCRGARLLGGEGVSSENNPAWKSVLVAPQNPRQGHLISVVFEGLWRPSKYQIEFNGKKFPLYRISSGRVRALIPTDPDTPSGPLDIMLKQKSLLRSRSWKIPINLSPGGFREQIVNLDADKEELFEKSDEPEGRKQKESLKKAIATKTSLQLWLGNFVAPNRAKASGLYGGRRIYNGKPSESFHRGIDYPGRQGDPVVASNNGRIVYAGQSPLEGNGVVVDHGQGVTTLYIHLSEICVNPGQSVKTGHAIGKIGSSGVATGPHLHFGVYVHAIAINPSDFIDRPIPEQVEENL